MKKTLKIMLVILFGVAAMGTFSGCKKEVRYEYKYFGLDEMYYISGNESTVRAFFSELDGVLNRYNGTNSTDSDIVSATQKVVTQYNWDVIKGTFYLKKSPLNADSWTTIGTFTMKYNFYYSTGNGIEGKIVENENFIQNENN